MCKCNKRAVKLLKKLGFRKVVRDGSMPVMTYATHRIRLDLEFGSLKRHHFRLSFLALAARIFG